MTGIVLDASALLALLLDEPGADRAEAALDRAMISDVNMAEIVNHYAKIGASLADIRALLSPLPIRNISVDLGLSYEAGMLRPVTIQRGLSLGDRYCLALAKREGAVALTAERRWPDVADAAGVVVDVIR